MKLIPALLLVSAVASSTVLAETPARFDPDITPDTVVHRAGQQVPVQSGDTGPFEVDPLVATLQNHLPPVQTGLTDFTVCRSKSRVHPDDLISLWGQSH